MKIIFTIIAILTFLASLAILGVAKSAIHEILAALLIISFIISLGVLAILDAMGAHLKVIKRIHNRPEDFIK